MRVQAACSRRSGTRPTGVRGRSFWGTFGAAAGGAARLADPSFGLISSMSGASCAQIKQSVGVTQAARSPDGSDDDALLALSVRWHQGMTRRSVAGSTRRLRASRAPLRRRREPWSARVGPDCTTRSDRLLVEAGADPDTRDKSGVAPLHRAVRTRSSDAVAALIEHDANPTLMNGSSSTPLHLAVQNTGKSKSGSDVAEEEQRRIIAKLLEYGASPTDVDANGKTVAAAASSDWIR